MKKYTWLFLSVFTLPVFAETVSDFTNMCAATGYKRLYAIFPKNEYTCLPGFFLPADAETCVACPNGYTCDGGTFNYSATDAQGLTRNSQNELNAAASACAANTVPKRLYAVFVKEGYTCPSGQFLPANSTTCATCPSGYTCSGGVYPFDARNAQGLVKVSSDAYVVGENACAINTVPKRLYAIMTPLTYTCSSGYFLPANSTECASCPNGYTCAGGTFPVNTTTAQGLVRNSDYIVNGLGKACALNQVHALNAVFTINSYDCAPGYYLVADAEECTICPAGSYCVGGRYTFNETTTQGIEPCPDGTISMAGAPACYPHILHIGDDIVYLKSEKLTTPSLNIGMNGEVFYANMTTEPTLMNSRSEHYLKLEYNNTVYHVCDDTTFAQ